MLILSVSLQLSLCVRTKQAQGQRFFLQVPKGSCVQVTRSIMVDGKKNYVFIFTKLQMKFSISFSHENRQQIPIMLSGARTLLPIKKHSFAHTLSCCKYHKICSHYFEFMVVIVPSADLVTCICYINNASYMLLYTPLFEKYFSKCISIFN